MNTYHPSRCMASLALALTLLVIFIALSGPVAGHAAEATIIVTNPDDSGPGSLRQAILDVEAGGTILFDPSLAGGTIVLTSGQVEISKSLTIDASAAVSLTVDGNRASRVLFIAAGAMVDLVALAITGGKAPINEEGANPHGGGILNLGNLTLTRCMVVDNRAGDSADFDPFAPDPGSYVPYTGGDGGGIYNQGRLVLRHTIVSNNAAGVGGPAVWVSGGSGGNGGGIANSGKLEVMDGAIQANQAGKGGQHLGEGPAAGSGGHGGGLYSTGTATTTRALIADNRAGDGHYTISTMSWYLPGSAGGNGGGIYLGATGRLMLIDSSVRNNSGGSGIQGGAGGGLFSDGAVWLVNGVFAGNHAGALQGHGSGGGAITNYGTLVVRDSLLDGNASGVAGRWDSNGGDGGGLLNHGTAHLIDSAVINNITSPGNDGAVAVSCRGGGSPGGHGGNGAGLWNDGTLMLTRVTVDSNQAGAGGRGGTEPYGFLVFYGLAGGNGGSGGGLWNSGLLMVWQSTISNNAAGAAGAGRDGQRGGGDGGHGGDGGGVFNSGVATLVNTTLNGDAAGQGGNGGSATFIDPNVCLPPQPCRAGDGGNGGSGGGFYNSYSLAMDNSTVAFNSAAVAGVAGQGLVGGVNGVAGAGGGVYGVFAARDTILGWNSAPGQGPDCAGRIAVGSHNLLHRPAGCVIDPGVANNVIGQSPLLLSLALNAPGTTATHALTGGSPAVGAGNCSAGTVSHDQRGVLRPQGAGCDIGAYEFDGPTGQFLWLPSMLRSGTP